MAFHLFFKSLKVKFFCAVLIQLSKYIGLSNQASTFRLAGESNTVMHF